MPAYVYIGNQLQIVILTYFRSHGYSMYTLGVVITVYIADVFVIEIAILSIINLLSSSANEY